MNIHCISTITDFPVFRERLKCVSEKKKSYTVCPLAELVHEHSCYELSLITVTEVWLTHTQTFPHWPGIKYPATGNNLMWQHNHQRGTTAKTRVAATTHFITSLHPRCIPISTSFSAAVSILSLVKKQGCCSTAPLSGRISRSQEQKTSCLGFTCIAD